MFVSLHRLNEEGHQRFETLAADPVRRLPDHNQRIADCLIIKSARGPWSAPCGLFAAQHPHGVLAMKTGHCDELIQNAGFPRRSLLAYRSRTATTARNAPGY